MSSFNKTGIFLKFFFKYLSLMEQVTKNNNTTKKKGSRKPSTKKKKLYGTSKLEEDFARDFLDKLKLRYIYQFKTNIGRWYDFYLTDYRILIEIDGGYWHSDPRIVKEDKLTPTQKHNKRVDEDKNRWALLHGIPLIRIWEKDIRENPNQVMNMLRERLKLRGEDIQRDKNMAKRHINKLNENKN